MRCGELLREIEPARGAKQNMRWKLADAYHGRRAQGARNRGEALARYRNVARAERTLSVAKTGLARFAVIGLAQVGVDASQRRFDPVFFGIEPCRGHGAVGFL